MTIAEITIAEKLGEFTRQYADGHYCLELLRFLGRYPRTRFSEMALVHALNSNPGKRHTNKALKQLVDKGVVRMSIDNIPLYSLTEDEPLCSLASDLAKLDWHQWQLVFRQTIQVPGE